MTDAYTYIAKPADSTYVSINPAGKQFYDQFDVIYDDSSVFYDGADPNAYTLIGKPTFSTWDDMLASWDSLSSITWDSLNKPGYTTVAKPTI